MNILSSLLHFKIETITMKLDSRVDLMIKKEMQLLLKFNFF